LTVKKISAEALKRGFENGLGVTETARQLGVSKGGVSKAARKLKITLRKPTEVEQRVSDLTFFYAGEVVAKEINAVDQLQKINAHANELLDLLMRWGRGDDEALQILESQVRKVKIGRGEKAHEITEYRMKDPRELALRAMQEIRGQIQLQFEIFSKLYDMESIAQFQEAILTTIAEVDADVRKRIIEKLKDRRVLRSITKCD